MKHQLSKLDGLKFVCRCGVVVDGESLHESHLGFADHLREEEKMAQIVDGAIVMMRDGGRPRAGEVVLAGMKTAFVRFAGDEEATLVMVDKLERIHNMTLEGALRETVKVAIRNRP